MRSTRIQNETVLEIRPQLVGFFGEGVMFGAMG
jgi:hypothetical protein